MILIKSSLNRLLLMNNRSSLIVNRFLKFHFIVIIMRMFMTFIKPIALIVKFIIIFSLLIFSKSVEMRIMRKHLEYKII